MRMLTGCVGSECWLLAGYAIVVECMTLVSSKCLDQLRGCDTVT